MKFKISRASNKSVESISGVFKEPDNNYHYYIMINTLEEMMSIIKETGENIVVSNGSITIYDGVY
jgi:hypothetical protein